MPRSGPRLLALLAIAASSVSLLSGRAAQASPSLTIAGEGFVLDGEQRFREVLVKQGFALDVTPASAGKGWLYLRANRIVVEEGAAIRANGAGHRGIEGAAGEGPGGGAVAEGAPTDFLPGGGGAHFGLGGQGVGAGPDCPLIGGLGGEAYGKPSDAKLGSAGGAALAPGGATRGGAGGGGILLEAAHIEIHGTIEANGEDGLASGSGGGAGGAIVILTPSLVLGPAAVLRARGGQGGAGKDIGGGGGGGGLVLVAAPPVDGPKPNVSGGAAGSACTDPALGAGTAGEHVAMDAPAACLDLDGDGSPARECGGGDCDDVDAAIAPGKADPCDGIDNDCSGQADDAPDICPAGTACAPDGCVAQAVDAGAAASAAPPASPHHVEFTGGCAVHDLRLEDRSAAARFGLAAAALALALHHLRARSRRGRARHGAPAAREAR